MCSASCLTPVPDFERDGSQFDALFEDGHTFTIGNVPVTVDACSGAIRLPTLPIVVGDAVFTGDTMFMPDYATARADFPGGDARTLFRSLAPDFVASA